MFVQCEDDPNFESTYGDACSTYSVNPELCPEDTNAEGVSASEACPASCGTGCALTFDSCWNSPCQNGGVCVNLLGGEGAFRCDCAPGSCGLSCEFTGAGVVGPGASPGSCKCAAGFCTENCATPDTLDHSDGNPQCV